MSYRKGQSKSVGVGQAMTNDSVCVCVCVCVFVCVLFNHPFSLMSLEENLEVKKLGISYVIQTTLKLYKRMNDQIIRFVSLS